MWKSIPEVILPARYKQFNDVDNFMQENKVDTSITVIPFITIIIVHGR